MKRRFDYLLSAFVVLSLLLPAYSAFALAAPTKVSKPSIAIRPWLPTSFAQRIIKARLAKIDKLIKSSKFADAEKEASQLAVSIKLYRLSPAETKSIQSSIYRTQVCMAQEKQGKYNDAASTVRKAMAIQRSSADIGKLITLQKSVVKQKQKYNLITNYNKKMSELSKNKLPILNQKIGAINKLLSQNNVSAKDMKALQASLAKYTKSLKSVAANMTKVNKDYIARMKKYELGGVILTTAQNKVVKETSRARYETVRETYKLQAEVAKNLTKITEKFKFSWDNLAADFKKLSKVQNKILALKKRIASMVSMKKIFSDADKKVLTDLRNQLRENLAEANKLYKEVEKAFIDQRKFASLSPKEQEALSAQFAKAWTKNNQIYKDKPTIGTLYKLIADKLRAKPPVVSRPVSAYEKMMITALFGKEAVKAVRPNSNILGGATKYYDKDGKLICSQNGSLGPKYRWLDANGKPVNKFNTGISSVSRTDPQFKSLSDMFNAFPSHKLTIYEQSDNGFTVKTLYFDKAGRKIGTNIKAYAAGVSYPRETWLDRNDKPVDRIIRLDPKEWENTVKPMPATYTVNATATAPVSESDNERATTELIDKDDTPDTTDGDANLMDF